MENKIDKFLGYAVQLVCAATLAIAILATLSAAQGDHEECAQIAETTDEYQECVRATSWWGGDR